MQDVNNLGNGGEGYVGISRKMDDFLGPGAEDATYIRLELLRANCVTVDAEAGLVNRHHNGARTVAKTGSVRIAVSE